MDFQTVGLNGVFGYFCRRGQKYPAPGRGTPLLARETWGRTTLSARLPRRRRLDNGLGMGIIKIRGRCDKRSALYDNDFFRKKPSPCRVAVSAFYDDRDRERPDM